MKLHRKFDLIFAIFLFPKEKWQKRKRPHDSCQNKFSTCSLKFPKTLKRNPTGNFLTLTSLNL
ncbi:MAG TPA: hypothetical protein DIC35_04995 [Candidatus Moranbacteria bacterium]|nr:hypothetical protein [Candidatus Moranbacteria bacterium]